MPAAYHYTTWLGALGILERRAIRQSTKSDGHLPAVWFSVASHWDQGAGFAAPDPYRPGHTKTLRFSALDKVFGLARLVTSTSDLISLSECWQRGLYGEEMAARYWNGASIVGANADNWHVWLRGDYAIDRCTALELFQDGEWRETTPQEAHGLMTAKLPSGIPTAQTIMRMMARAALLQGPDSWEPT